MNYLELLAQIRPALPIDTPVYLVGGAIRDALMGRPINDLDFAVDGDAVRVGRRVANHLEGDFFVMDQERGTSRVLLKRPDGNHMMIDFAALRGRTLEEDLLARDFTVNAIAVDAHEPQQVYDPLKGAQDIKDHLLKACSPDTFKNDPLRILRAVRQAAELRFVIARETRTLIRAAVGSLQQVSAERKRDEVLKILGGRKPAATLRVLDVLGVMPEIFPELAELKGVTQSPPHVYDVWEHTLSTIHNLETVLGFLGSLEHDPDRVSSFSMGFAILKLGRYRKQFHSMVNQALVTDRKWRPLLFLAALYHDAGKPRTRTVEENGRIRFLGHEQVSADMLSLRAHELKLSNIEINRLKTIVRHHMRPHLLVQTGKSPTRRAVYRFFRDTKEAGVDICLLNMADVLGTYASDLPYHTWEQYINVLRDLLEAFFENPEEKVKPPPLLNGSMLIEELHIQPGPLVGRLLETIREAQAVGDISTPEEALSLAQATLAGLDKPDQP